MDATAYNAAALRELDTLADWLDSRFRLPGTNLRFGLDSLIGLIPGVGDGATALPAIYIVLRAQRMGAPKRLLLWMSFNVALDFVVGAIPLLGDLFDVGFKANRRNIDLLRRHFSGGMEMPGPAPVP